MKIYSVRIIASSPEALRLLDRFDLDLKHRAARQIEDARYAVPGTLSEEEVARVREAGYEVELVEDLSSVAAERQSEVSRDNRFADAGSMRDFAVRRVNGYLNPAEVEAALMSLRTLYPALVTLIELPHRTWEGRVSHAVRVRAGARHNRPGVFFTGSIHAREWGGSDICIAFITNLIDAYRAGRALSYGGKTFTASQVRTIMENIDIYLFPDVNPDGKEYSQTRSLLWRKNRNPNGTSSATDQGVDVNRNFDFLWGSGIGTSSIRSSSTYKGTAPFSEPESRNVQYMFDTFPNIRYYVDIHCHGEMMLYSWGDDENQSTDPAQNLANPAYDGTRGTVGDTRYREFISTLDRNTAVGLANRMYDALAAVRGKRYTVQQAVGLYPTSGTSDDYAFSRHVRNPARPKVYGYTIEFGTEFVPPYAEMTRIIDDIAAALTELCLAANSDVYLRDNLADTGNVPSTGAFWNSPDIWVRNANDGGTDHQDTIRGRDNFVHVRVHNRGLAEVQRVKVRLCLTHFAGTEFIYPQDWIPRNPAGGGVLSGPGTYLIGETEIASVGAGGSQTVRFRWPAALIPPETGWHPCLLVEVAPNDGAVAGGRHVWQDNGLAQKNLTIINASRGALIDFPFMVGSRFGKGAIGELGVRRLAGPALAAVYLDPEAVPLKPTRPVIKRPGLIATILEPVLVEIPYATAGRDDASGALLFRLPASATVETFSGAVASLLNPLADTATTLLKPLLPTGKLVAISPQKESKIPLSLKEAETRTMALKFAVPHDAKVGERYQFEVVQYDAQRNPVGGVVLEVRVKG